MLKNTEDLSLFITMSFFFCNITRDNYSEVYSKLNNTPEEEFNPSDFALWSPFVDYYDLNDLLEEIDRHIDHIERNINSYENSISE